MASITDSSQPVPSYEPKHMTDDVDDCFVNLLTYGMHGSWELQTGHHSLAHKISTDDREGGTTNLEWILDNWIALGADRSKLNIGTIYTVQSID